MIRNPKSDEPERDEPDEADFGATLRWMAAIFGGIVLLALIIGWLLTR